MSLMYVIIRMYSCWPGGMVDAMDSKSIGGNTVRVQVPRPAP